MSILMIRIFYMLYEIFYYMVFTRYSVGKIWSSICMQDTVKTDLHHQINLIIPLTNIITRFLYQICLTDKSDGNNYLCLEKTSQTSKMKLFVNIFINEKPLTIFTKSFALDL